MQTPLLTTDKIASDKDASKFIDTIQTIMGWVKTCRSGGGKKNPMAFVELTDGLHRQHLQLVFLREQMTHSSPEEVVHLFKTGAGISVIGKIIKSPKPGQFVEMQVHSYEVLGPADPDTYPLPKVVGMKLDTLRQMLHLRQRAQTFQAITRIKSTLIGAITLFFLEKDFIQVQPTETTDNECEAGADPFTVTTMLSEGRIDDVKPRLDDPSKIDFSLDFYGKRCYLTVSSQLHLEATCMALSKVWCMTIAFRGEKSTGPRHLSEFYMPEWELITKHLSDNMAIAEGLLKYCFRMILDKHRLDIEFLQDKYTELDDKESQTGTVDKGALIDRLERYVTESFAVTTHEDCVKTMLADIENGKITIDPHKKPDGDIYVFKVAPAFDDDLTKDHERYITEVIFGNMPVFVRYFPKKVKAFYMPVIDEGAKIEHVDGYDLLFPIVGEVVGGSQRETDYEKLIARMHELGMDPDKLKFYTDLRKWGSLPHGGAGLGLDRAMMVVTGILNIRDMIPFPRHYQSCQY